MDATRLQGTLISDRLPQMQCSSLHSGIRASRLAHWHFDFYPDEGAVISLYKFFSDFPDGLDPTIFKAGALSGQAKAGALGPGRAGTALFRTRSTHHDRSCKLWMVRPPERTKMPSCLQYGISEVLGITVTVLHHAETHRSSVILYQATSCAQDSKIHRLMHARWEHCGSPR
jgi:hypothetical protein